MSEREMDTYRIKERERTGGESETGDGGSR